jgi:hypothetical protein
MAIYRHAADESSAETFYRTVEKVWNETIDACSVHVHPLPKECFDGVFKTMSSVGRNPRSKVVDASHLLA